ncbi:glycosyltransferase family 2 protein [Chryseobacterium wangxinyae]|uniref:glycosyltransferase family 2 protein n=1 Tax=Chryseobacterium sp. CY353 TaxID=2997334 RepID=UPI00226D943A|nr:glycosyltransferase family A protein [Chryseobacterium sp. CY353]MCY0970992.1 glycosyltransferase family A protein [Chryseobacterium sp. CY353]
MLENNISVIIPVYNSQSLIKETVDSILNQTLKPKEIIIINDGSTDDSWQILQKLAEIDSTIKIFNQENIGASITRNKGVEYAEGEWICFVDADDLLHPQRLEIAAEFSKNFDAVICDMTIFDNNTIPNNKRIEVSQISYLSLESTYKSIIEYGYALWSALMKKDAFIKAGGIDKDLVNNEDFELHFRMVAKRFKFIKINASLYNYRQHTSDSRLSLHKDRMVNISNALDKMSHQIEYLPEELQEYSKISLSNKIANNALKQAMAGDASFRKNLLKAKVLNKNLAPYGKGYFNVVSSLFGYGNLEKIIGKLISFK